MKAATPFLIGAGAFTFLGVISSSVKRKRGKDLVTVFISSASNLRRATMVCFPFRLMDKHTMRHPVLRGAVEN